MAAATTELATRLEPTKPGAAHETRRTFAIISHPDAGKTTLTEKLLLRGGAIRLAGAVKARGDARRARSDWMRIEQQRGISVTSSVMTFEHDGLTFNLLDTPGHEDFSEDTYRTLTAVDSAIMVIDAAKGIEAQTRKLFEVCRLRDIPIITFINKVDREGRDPFELLAEIETTLALDVCPLVWPVGMGTDFHGCYDLVSDRLLSSSAGRAGAFDTVTSCQSIADPMLDRKLAPHVLETFRLDAELASSGYPKLDPVAYREGHLTPVLFGSALRGFAVAELLNLIGSMAPPPQPQPTASGRISPMDPTVSGFVFKVQANMDPQHRDRIAFVRLCSGRFRRGMRLKNTRSGRSIAVQSPIFFFAQEREVIDEAFPGDVIGVPNHGTLRVGDTLAESDEIRFTGLPAFAPEVLRRVNLGDTTRVKQLRRALDDLAEEGLVQIFKPSIGSSWIVGAVGALQLDVLVSRAREEYGVDITFESVPFTRARWPRSDDGGLLQELTRENPLAIVTDRDGSPVFLARNKWELQNVRERYPGITFQETRELF